MNEQFDVRIIKKYPNRRLYDTTESKYVTLSDLRDLVLRGVSFSVIDKKSNENITRSILLQIIIEQEDKGDPMFSTEVLEQLIGFYGKSVQGQAGDFMQSTIELFQEQQQRFQEQFEDVVQSNPLTSSFAEIAQRNMDAWAQMQKNFFQAAGFSRTDKKPKD